VPWFGIVGNMSSVGCPNCNHWSPIFGNGGAKAEAEKTGVRFLGEVPLHMEICSTSDEGRPVAASNPDGVHAKAYMAIATQVAELLQSGTTTRAAPKIVIE